MKPWVCALALYKVGVVKHARKPSTWEMEDNRFKTIFSYKQIQSQTDDDERRQKVVQHLDTGTSESLVRRWKCPWFCCGLRPEIRKELWHWVWFLVIFLLLLQILCLLVRMWPKWSTWTSHGGTNNTDQLILHASTHKALLTHGWEALKRMPFLRPALATQELSRLLPHKPSSVNL